MSESATTPHGCAHCTCGQQNDDHERLTALAGLIQDKKDEPGALIPVLQEAQALFGYLPDSVLKEIARGLNKPYSEVAGVVSFYSFFSREPRGKHTIRVCMGTACYVRGAKQVLDRLSQELDVAVGSTTADRQFTLEAARCIGACSLAPAILVDDDVVGDVKPDDVPKLIAKYTD